MLKLVGDSTPLTEFQAFHRLLRLKPDPLHEGYNDSEVIARDHLRCQQVDDAGKATGGQFILYRGMYSYYVYDCGVQREATRLLGKRTVFTYESDNDFRVRRFIAMILQDYGYAPAELEIIAGGKHDVYRYPNIARVGVRYAAYQMKNRCRTIGKADTAERLLAYGDTPAEALTIYHEVKRFESGGRSMRRNQKSRERKARADLFLSA